MFVDIYKKNPMISKYLKNSTVKMAPDNYNLIGIIFTKPYIHHRL